MIMKHIVTIWGANFSTEEELEAFTETLYDDEGDARPSAFLISIGCSWIDEDFQELHFFRAEEDRKSFINYLRLEYSQHQAFVEQLPAAIDEAIQAYNAIILQYGNQSPYGTINEELFRINKAGLQAVASPVLLACVEYES